ncbi:MAG: CapA family protein [Muribaculaceae bacterium]|nr:CapA family protein [Muribaculaceae bacterium]
MNGMLSIMLLSLLSLLEGNFSIEMTFVGDAMQHGPQIKAARQADGTYDYIPCFKYVEDDIKGADYAVVNLECPLGGTPYSGYPAFSAPDEYAAELKRVGFDLFTTANNHCLDRRDSGLKRTLDVLDRLGVAHAGTYRNKAERERALPLVVGVKGVKIGFLSYTYGTNGIPVQGDAVVDIIDKKQIKADIAAARKAGAQMMCVCMHWGIEYVLKPVQEQKNLADFLVGEGVDLIIGSHPHVVEPWEIRYSPEHGKRVLVVYSLGNFISNQTTIDSRGGSMVKVRIDVSGDRPEVRDAECKLFFVQKPRMGGENYVLIPEGREDLLRADSKGEYNTFMSRTRKTLGE